MLLPMLIYVVLFLVYGFRHSSIRECGEFFLSFCPVYGQTGDGI